MVVTFPTPGRKLANTTPPPRSKDMTEYTDDQVNEAIMLANQTIKVYAWETEMYRNVIKHLPEPASDDWQQCSWGGVLHTDERVKAEYISGTIIEGVPDGISDNGVYLVDGNLIPYSTDAKWYRIPAPVTHPDPAEHPVILVRESVNTKYDKPIPMIWDGGDFYESPKASLHISTITGWTPAKVVADDD